MNARWPLRSPGPKVAGDGLAREPGEKTMTPRLSRNPPVIGQAVDGTEPPPGDRGLPSVLIRRRWTLIVIILLVFGTAMVLTWRQTRLYASTAKVLIEQPLGSSTTTSANAANMATEKEVAESAAVAILAARRLHATVPPQQLSAGLSVEVPVDTEILELSYLSPSPPEAQRRAQAFAVAYLDFRREEVASQLRISRLALEQRIRFLTERLSVVNESEAHAATSHRRAQARAERTSLVTQIGILQQKLADLTLPDSALPGLIVQAATLPQAPARPNLALNAFLGLLAGCVLGVGGALAQEYADDRIRSAKDLESLLRVPVLTTMSRLRLHGNAPYHLVALHMPESTKAERFRQLRTNLVFASIQNNASSILVTSAREKEGKTFVAANVSIALAKVGSRVILVSADLRRPRLEEMFLTTVEVGLVEVLLEQVPWTDAVLETGVPNLRLLPSGSQPGNPTELLGSNSMVALIQGMRREADYIIVDAGPLLPVADALAIVPACDAVLFVASARKATRGTMARAREQLARVDATVLGAVLLDAREEEEIPPPYPYAGERPLARGLRLPSRSGS
jgi:succinoglycan biosynthesis transport protein ExoP